MFFLPLTLLASTVGFRYATDKVLNKVGVLDRSTTPKDTFNNVLGLLADNIKQGISLVRNTFAASRPGPDGSNTFDDSFSDSNIGTRVIAKERIRRNWNRVEEECAKMGYQVVELAVPSLIGLAVLGAGSLAAGFIPVLGPLVTVASLLTATGGAIYARLFGVPGMAGSSLEYEIVTLLRQVNENTLSARRLSPLYKSFMYQLYTNRTSFGVDPVNAIRESSVKEIKERVQNFTSSGRTIELGLQAISDAGIPWISNWASDWVNRRDQKTYTA